METADNQRVNQNTLPKKRQGILYKYLSFNYFHSTAHLRQVDLRRQDL